MPVSLKDVLEVWPGSRVCAPGEVAPFKADGLMEVPPLKLGAGKCDIEFWQRAIIKNQKEYSREYKFKNQLKSRGGD